MSTALNISFCNVFPSPGVEKLVREQAQALTALGAEVIGYGVDIEMLPAASAPPCRVRLNVTLPQGRQLVIMREHLGAHAHASIYWALCAAFEAAKIRLGIGVPRKY